MDAIDANDFGTGSLRHFAILLLSFTILASVLYKPALEGPFLSDDGPMIAENELLRSDAIDLASEAFDPTGRLRFQLGGNYAPVAVLALGLEWRL